MKYPIIILAIIFCSSREALSQTAVAIELAQHIAQKMKDTLNLTVPQRNLVYGINILLHNRKTAIRQQYTNTDSVRYYLQRAENRRDSLYRNILNEEKYLLYKVKKRVLISNN